MKYNAFISYRHSELDMYVAKKIHKKLETFKPPRDVKNKLGKNKIERVFRDQEELPIGNNLSDNIQQALRESQYLIVICSPRTPESHWVQKEIETFIALHGRQQILAVLIEGEPRDSFPKQLLVDDNGEPVEPLAADVRGSSKREVGKKIRTEVVRLAASLLGCSYDELRQRHRERKMKRALFASAAAAVVAISFGAYSVYNTMMIQKNYEGKQINQSKYLADTALTLFEEGDRVAAGLIALEALPSKENDRPYVASAQYALGQTLNVYDNGNSMTKDCLLKHDLQVEDMTYSYDGTKIVSIDLGMSIYVWDVEKGTLLVKIAPEIDDYGSMVDTLKATITKSNNLVIATANKIYARDLEDNEIWKIEAELVNIDCVFDMEAEIAAIVSGEVVNFIDMTNGNNIGSMKNTIKNSYFSDEGKFNAEHDKFIVDHVLDKDAENGKVSVYDLKKSAKTEYTTKGSHIVEQSFCADGNFVVMSGKEEEFRIARDKKAEVFIEKIDIVSGKVIWTQIVKMDVWRMDTKESILKCRKYIDNSTNKENDEVLLSVNNGIYVWDSLNGQVISEINMTSQISAFLVSVSSDICYIVENNGAMNILELTREQNISNLLDIGRPTDDVLIKNGVLAARLYNSPDIMLMKVHKGYGMEVQNEYTLPVYKMDYSSDESYYVVEMNESLEYFYSFYKSENDLPVIEQYSPSTERILKSGFINETEYVMLDEQGKLIVYDVEKKEEKVIELEVGEVISGFSFSQNNKYAFVYNTYTYCAVDLQSKKIIAEGTFEDGLVDGIISEDGSVFYGCKSDKSLIRIEIGTGNITSIDEYHLTVENIAGSVFAISPNGKLLAISCQDNKIYILNTKKMKKVDEIEFSSQSCCFIRFSMDNQKLVMQGDTLYFQIYDIKQKEFAYISTTQNYLINNIIYNNESNTVCFITSVDMLILNEKNYEPLAYVNGGLTYMSKHGFVYNRGGNTIFRFPYMDLKMLIKEAKSQFEGTELTKRERIKYNID